MVVCKKITTKKIKRNGTQKKEKKKRKILNNREPLIISLQVSFLYYTFNSREAAAAKHLCLLQKMIC